MLITIARKFPQQCFLAFSGKLHLEDGSMMSLKTLPFMSSQELWSGHLAKMATMHSSLSRIRIGVLFQRPVKDGAGGVKWVGIHVLGKH